MIVNPFELLLLIRSTILLAVKQLVLAVAFEFKLQVLVKELPLLLSLSLILVVLLPTTRTDT
jgi:hypothetical protein